MANSADSRTSLNDSVAIMGIAGVLILAGLIAWFYGTRNETSAAGLLNTVVPVVGTIVGLVFGVSYGNKSGKDRGQAAGAEKTRIALKSLSESGDGLRQLKSNLADHKGAHTRHAQVVAQALASEKASQSDVHKLSEEHVTEIIDQIDKAITQNDIALHLISG